MTIVFWLVLGFLLGLIARFLYDHLRKGEHAHPKTVSEEQGTAFVLEATFSSLADVCVDDVMIPRPNIQAIDLEDDPTLLRQQIVSYHHLRLPVYESVLDKIVGVLDLRDALRLSAMPTLDVETLRALLRPAYYIPSATPLLKQIEQFRLDEQRMGLVVDEYGELQGLVTQSDLTNEIAATLLPQKQTAVTVLSQDGIVIDASTPLRALNRRIGSDFPLDGPKTLSGLIIENLGEIPEAGTQFDLYGYRISVLQVKKNRIYVVKLRMIDDEKTFLKAPATTPPLQIEQERALSDG
ncbi:MAG: CBS domain-containing protein [Burkholderiales bacterium]|jgi:Mg2+/Co2+ transporter CorB|nr:CBS domain-containing protein [Burkholderiales bacterium]